MWHPLRLGLKFLILAVTAFDGGMWKSLTAIYAACFAIRNIVVRFRICIVGAMETAYGTLIWTGSDADVYFSCMWRVKGI